MTDGQSDADYGEDLPSCPSCGVPWRDHQGPTAMCAEIQRLSVSLDEEVAVGNWKFTEGFAWTAEREEEFREEWRREHAT